MDDNTEAPEHVEGLTVDNPTQDADELRRALARLGRHLAALDEGAGPTAEVETWADGESLYLEAQLPAELAGWVDLSIHDRRIFIRMAR